MGEPSGRVHGLLRRLCLEARLTQEELAEAAWLSDSVRVSIARHRVTDTADICHGPGEASAVSSQSLTRALSPSAPYRRPGYGQGNRPGQPARDVTGATRPPGARS